MGDESHPKTLYVGNLDAGVSEDFLYALFGQIGEVKGCKIIREPGNDPYAFLEFTNHTAAAKALAVLNKRVFLEKEMKVNWATSTGLQNMGDESHQKTLYVGNLDAGVTEDFLYALFGQIGEVKGCKIIREPGNDPYAFLEFTNHTAAAKALAVLNKRVFLEKEMKVNWATSPGLYTT